MYRLGGPVCERTFLVTDTPTTPPSPTALDTLPAQLRYWRVAYSTTGALGGLLLGTALATAWYGVFGGGAKTFTAMALLPGSALAVALAVAAYLYAGRRFSRYRGTHFPLEGVRLQDGVWWQTETWIPITRLQHLDVQQGPLDRRWSMATLSLHTAGTHDHRLRIKGLPLEQAYALRDALMPRLQVRHD